MRIRDPRSDVIVDLSTGTLTVIDHSQEQYWQATQGEVNAALARSTDDPQNDSRAASMTGGLMGASAPPSSVQKGPGTRQIAGYTCQEYLVTVGPLKEQLWLTTQLNAPVSLAQWAAAQKTMFASAGPLATSMSQVMDELAKTNGFPMGQNTTTTFMGRRVQTSSEASEVRRGPLPASTFAVPEGFTKVPSPYVPPHPTDER